MYMYKTALQHTENPLSIPGTLLTAAPIPQTLYAPGLRKAFHSLISGLWACAFVRPETPSPLLFLGLFINSSCSTEIDCNFCPSLNSLYCLPSLLNKHLYHGWRALLYPLPTAIPSVTARLLCRRRVFYPDSPVALRSSKACAERPLSGVSPGPRLRLCPFSFFISH